MFPDVLPTFRERRANQKARLRLLNLKLEGSTVAIVVNGFSSGHHIIERLAWPMRTFRRHRIGVALFALPFHGPRASMFPPEWPGVDLQLMFEGFRQAVWDLRIAIRALREAGVKHVGVVGMSLGGYTASLIAPERMAVISGELDQLAPVKHGAQLAEHFGARHIVFRGAHLVQKGRARAFEDAFEGFERAGVLPRRR
jgi:pimeloyl-ACP methyl ester carboxylesterase